MRPEGYIAAAAAAVAAVVVLLAGCGGGETARAPDTANLWIAPTAGDAPQRCDKPCAYDPAHAYGSLKAAYQAAEGGDEIRVKAGDYRPQKTTPSGLTDAVTVRPARGEAVTFAGLTTRGDWLTLRDIAIPTGDRHRRGWYNAGGSHNTLANVDISGPFANVNVTGGSHNTYRDSDFGTPDNTLRRLCGTGDGEPVELTASPSFTLANNTFHPFHPEKNNPACGPDGVLHLETVRVNDGMDDLRVVGNRFLPGDGSGTARLFVTKLTTAGKGDNPDRLIVANNFFGDADGTVSVLLGENVQCVGYVIAYNYWVDGFDVTCQAPERDSLTFIGNLSEQPDYLPCPGSQPGRNNLWVWTAAKTGCGTDRWIVSEDGLAAFRHAADGYHLTAESPAIDAGERGCDQYTGGVDIDGDKRGPVCDAGPDEYER